MIERMSPVGYGQTRLDYFYLTPNGEAVSDTTFAMSDQVTAEDKGKRSPPARSAGFQPAPPSEGRLGT